MNTRRSFLKRLGLIAAGVAAGPHIFIPKLEKAIWKTSAPMGFVGDMGVLNTGLILQRNLAYLKTKLLFLEAIQDPETGLWLQRTTWEDDLGNTERRIEVIPRIATSHKGMSHILQ